MPVMRLILDEPAWPDMDMAKVVDYQEPIEVAALPNGLSKGGTAIAFRFDLPDGQIVIAQTSLALLNMIVRGVVARYPDPPGVGMNAP